MVLFLPFLLVFSSVTAQNETQKKEICLTRNCISASNRIFEYMNDKADPCEDFNEFACGNFIKNQIIPDDESRWMVFDILTKQIENQGRKLLESPIDEKEEFQSYNKAKIFYKSCVNEAKQEELGSQPLLDLLDQIGGWPVLSGDKWQESDFNLWPTVLKVMSLGYSNDFFFSFYFGADLKNNSYNVLYLDQADLGLSKEYWDKGREEPEVKAYFQFMLGKN